MANYHHRKLTMKIRKRNAYTIYLFMSGASSLIYSLFNAVVYVYLASNVTNDPFQLVFIWTVFMVTTLLFEIPTGVVADVYSRRLSVIIGFALTGVGAAIEGIFPVFEIVLLAQVIWSIGFTFISGAEDAWITDEIGEEPQKETVWTKVRRGFGMKRKEEKVIERIEDV